MGEEVLVISYDPPAVQSFNSASGELTDGYRISGSVESALLDRKFLWTTGLNYGTWTLLRRAERGSESARSMLPIPDGFAQGGPLGIFHEISLEKWGDTLMVALEPTNELYVVTETGHPVETISVPVRVRRGVPEDPAEEMTTVLGSRPYSDVFTVLSALRGIHRRADGSFLLVHYDYRPEGSQTLADVYVTVLSADRARACVDIPIPVEGDVLPAIGFEGDHLLILEQVIGSTLEAQPVLRVLDVDAGACDWVPIR